MNKDALHLLLWAMFINVYISDHVVSMAHTYDCDAEWVKSIRGVTDICDREEAAKYAAREFCYWYTGE